MATEVQHQRQAEHNQRCLHSIDTLQFPDWAATVAFYKAVHLVEVLMARKSLRTGSHVARNNHLKRMYPDLWREYRPLYTFSRMARYWCITVTQKNLSDMRAHLARFEIVLAKLL